MGAAAALTTVRLAQRRSRFDSLDVAELGRRVAAEADAAWPVRFSPSPLPSQRARVRLPYSDWDAAAEEEPTRARTRGRLNGRRVAGLGGSGLEQLVVGYRSRSHPGRRLVGAHFMQIFLFNNLSSASETEPLFCHLLSIFTIGQLYSALNGY